MSDIIFGENPEVNWEPNTYFRKGEQFTYVGVRYYVVAGHTSGNRFETSLPYLTTQLPIDALPPNAAGVLTNDGNGALSWGAGGGGGTTLPTDAAGHLANDGSGNLTWEVPASPLPANSAGHLSNDGSGNLSWVVPPTINVVDDLVTNTVTDPLSANMGRELKGYVDALVSISGVPLSETHLSTFTGAIISDNVSAKVALQELETAIEALPPATTIVDNLTTNSATSALSANMGLELKGYADSIVAATGIALSDTHIGVFSGSTISDNVTVKAALQELELAVESASTAKQSVVPDITGRDALPSPASGDLAYVVDASADSTVTTGSALYVYDGSAWQKISEFESLDFALSNLVPQGGATVGSAGTSTEISRSDHVHPFQGLSSDANNILTLGSDGLHELTMDPSGFNNNLANTDTTIQAVADKFDAYNGKPRVFATETAMAPAAAGNPTDAEVVTYIGTNSVTNTLLHYNGTNTATNEPTHAWWVDSAGTPTRVLSPAAKSQHIHIFNGTTDWGSPVSGVYAITVTSAVHGITDPSTVVVQEDTGTEWVVVSVDVGINKADGAITIRVPEIPDTRFAGRVVIK